MARLAGPNWFDELPWVLLGIRTFPKEDFKASSAELVYGEPLTVPVFFVAPHTAPWTPSFSSRLPILTASHGPGTFTVPKALKSAKFVFIRDDTHRSPLQRPHDGPFEVIAPGDKTFRIRIRSREELITIDRLKPACVVPNVPVPLSTT